MTETLINHRLTLRNKNGRNHGTFFENGIIKIYDVEKICRNWKIQFDKSYNKKCSISKEENENKKYASIKTMMLPDRLYP